MVYGISIWCMVQVWNWGPDLAHMWKLWFDRCMVYGVWCMVYGVLCVVYGVWCVMYGVWCVVYGVWCIVCGV